MDDMTMAVKDRLIAQLRAALGPYYEQSDPSAYVAMYANGATSFDPWSKGRKDDAAVAENLMSLAGTIPHLGYDLVRPRVDLIGDAAVFTFELDAKDRETGETVAVWNATQVHDLATEDAKLVHAHWSYAIPPGEAAG